MFDVSRDLCNSSPERVAQLAIQWQWKINLSNIHGIFLIHQLHFPSCPEKLRLILLVGLVEKEQSEISVPNHRTLCGI